MTGVVGILRVFADPKKVGLLRLICDAALPLHTLARAAESGKAKLFFSARLP